MPALTRILVWSLLLNVLVAMAQTDPFKTQPDPRFSDTLPGIPPTAPPGPPRHITNEDIKRVQDAWAKAVKEYGEATEAEQMYARRNQPGHPFYKPGAPPPDPVVEKALTDEVDRALAKAERATKERFDMYDAARSQRSGLHLNKPSAPKRPPPGLKQGVPAEEFWAIPWRKPKC